MRNLWIVVGLIVGMSFFLLGCTTQAITPQEQLRIDTAVAQQKASQAEAQRAEAYKQAMKYKALVDVSKQSTNSATLIAVGIMMEDMLQTKQPVQMQPAQQPVQRRGRDLYDWVMGLGGLAVDGFGIAESGRTSRALARYGRDATIKSYEALETMGSQIQAPTTSYNVGGSGVAGNGTYEYQDTRTASGPGSSTAGNGNYETADYTHAPTLVYPEVIWVPAP